MSTIDFSNARQPIDMTVPTLVGFGTVEAKTPTGWSWLTPTNNDIELQGSGLTYNAQGRALTGTIKSISIDLGNDDFANPDIVITGISAPAATLDNGQVGFWRFLEGNDTIIGPDVINVGFSKLFGDGFAARNGATGGDDTFQLGLSPVWVAGDVWTVGSQTKGGTTVKYIGGDDSFTGKTTDENQILSGDAVNVYAAAELRGGSDRIVLATGGFAEVAGDAFIAEGVAGDLATVIGGDDEISASGSPSRATLVGDVSLQKTYSFVRGGNDTVIGAANGTNDVVGDVSNVGDNRMVGGDDWIVGGRGGDRLYGDFASIGAGGKVVAGNDTVYGGDGDDYIYGDGSGGDGQVAGGNDRLFGGNGADNVRGDTGNDLIEGGLGRDFLIGGEGNDFLDGGRDVDYLAGGAGNDVYFVDDATDQAYEDVASGIDTVNTYLRTYSLGDNLENLRFIGSGNFNAFGNMFNNEIKGGAGIDTIIGLAGNDRVSGGVGADLLYGDVDNDVLNGGVGGDLIDGGDGIDVASYAGSEQAVSIALDGSVIAIGDAVGDSLNSIEGLEGTGFDDTLVGNINANRLIGGNGNDLLNGRGGADAMAGGNGNDVYVVDDAGDVVIEAAGSSGIDRVVSNRTFSLSDAAHAKGLIENLFLNGSEGIDAVGSSVANVIAGNGGANRITGLGGKDTLAGGGGDDTFVYKAAGNSKGVSADRILDFDDLGNDRIDLSSVFSGTLTYRGSGALTGANQVHIRDVAGPDVLVEVNLTGSLAPDMVIRLVGTTAGSITASDFIL